MTLKERLSDYTEQEFMDFLIEIDRANEDEPDEVLTPLLLHFRKIIEHPSGINLLYKPTTPEDGKKEKVIEIIKEWRNANGKDGFKMA